MRLCVIVFLFFQPPAPPAITVSYGDPVQTVNLTREAFAKLPRTTIQVKEGNGTTVEYSGYAMHEVLKLAKVPMGSDLRGRSVAPMIMLAEASDGAKVVFALAEVEPTFSDKIILLADTHDGKPMMADEGPYRIIVPSDKRHARWLRQVRSFSIKKL